MIGIDLINEVNSLTAELFAGVKAHEQYGRQLAEAEQAYQIARMTEILRLRDGGTPATLTESIAKGKTAKERFERDVAEVMLKTAQERINAIKLKIRVVEAQIEREWSATRHE